MKRNNKKGFTIVELVIVIAVIAILAAVLIPTFSSVIKKAKVNNDIQLVRNLNTALATDTKEHKTMQSALDAAFEFGYDVAKINDTSVDENKILWDSKNDVFCYLKDGEIEYIPNSVADDDKLSVGSYLLWKISNTVDSAYSTYLYNYEVTETTKDITAKKGLDVGTTKGITAIEYKNTTATPQEVVIRTNSQLTALTIDAPQDNIDHYGNAGKVTITAVKPESYHLYGAANEIALTSGKVEIEEGSFVGEVNATGGAVVIKGVVAKGVTGGNVTVSGNGTNGLTSSSVIKVGTAETLMNLAYAQSKGVFGNESLTIELTADIDLTGRTWVPFGASDYFFEGVIDGKGHTIKGIKNDGYRREGTEILSSSGNVQDPFGLISCAVGTVKISNLTIEVDIQNGGSSVGGFVGNYQKKNYQDVLEFTSCTVKGLIIAKDKVGGFVGSTYFATKKENNNKVEWAVDSYSTSNKTSFVDCHSNVEIIAEKRAGGFIGTNNSYKTIFTNCSFEKSVTVTSSSDKNDGNWAVGGYIGYDTSDPQKYDPNNKLNGATYASDILSITEKKSSVEIIFTSCTSTGTISGNADTSFSKAYIGRNDKFALVSGLEGANINTANSDYTKFSE
ncbi:MAG: prepilin-type N-terminal cleavage/methylation domain-containing protein [Clostridiales bacterium]|nr:prepilin-type N-terminal cleavage/methylation domain-containing protein [Clostridiales bacterium]